MNRIKEALKRAKVDAILISNMEPMQDNNFFAFSSIQSGSFMYSMLLLYKNKPILLVSELEKLEAKKTGLKYIVLKKLSDIKNKFPKIKTIGINYSLISLALAKKLKFKKVNVSKVLNEIRDVKDESEYERFEVACNIVSQIAEEIPSWIKKDITELELKNKIDERMLSLNSQPSFDTIVAFGENSAMPHHSPSNKKLKNNEIILIDFGAKYKNICSDMTRCFFYGNPSKEVLDVYDVVKKVQEESIKRLKPGVKGKKIYEWAKSTIEKNTKGIMNHSLGHGIGYDVHESSFLGISKISLPEDSFTTVEPGCYIEGKFGVRIEDCIFVRKDKNIQVTTAPKYLVIIPSNK
jgi:Xaa-Pro dipeptidase